jgi:hypothetical protein
MDHVITTAVIPATEGRDMELAVIFQGKTSWTLGEVILAVERENPTVWDTWAVETNSLQVDDGWWDRLELSEEQGFPVLDEWIFQRRSA